MVDDARAWASVRDVVGAWNRRDWSALESLYAANIVYESPHCPPIVGRSALRRREEELVAIVPDLHESELRMIANDAAGNWATFEFVQTGTLFADVPAGDVGARGRGSPFTVRTTMLVRFDDDGRVAGLRTGHN